VQMVKTQHIACVTLFMTIKCACRVDACPPWGGVGLGRCLVLWCRIFLPVECHTGLLLWQQQWPKHVVDIEELYIYT